jgi:hypothetical protein
MTAAHDYEDMHHLVDSLTPAQVRRLRLIITQDEELAEAVEGLPGQSEDAEDEETVPADLLALIGSVDTGRTDAAERHDDYIRERLQRRRSRSA